MEHRPLFGTVGWWGGGNRSLVVSANLRGVSKNVFLWLERAELELKMAKNPGFWPKIGFLAILDLIFAGVLSRGSLESVLKSSNFDLEDGLYAIFI